MIEFSHVNSNGAEKLSAYYGAMIKENYDIPDHSDDENYADWYGAYEEYKAKLEEAKTPAV